MSEKKHTETERLRLHIKTAHGDSVTFIVNPTTIFSKIFKAYEKRKGVGGFRYVFDGQRISQSKTPIDYEMKRDDTIDAFQEQIGG